ncbi:MAG: short-chain dehydrogenase/reductase [Gemmatimonadetes bacterium]|nr:short-chain dehydrogenase/reductase [Gemmatimonadota bacterium]
MTGALAGRSAVITGASRGIGLAIAQGLALAGARVVLVARTDADLQLACGEIGEQASCIPCDMSDGAAVQALALELQRRLSGAPDIMVNNAGQFELAAVEETSTHDFARMLDVNLVAPFILLRALLPAMHARGGGHVVNIGSIADRHTYPGNGAYAASKFGLRALHEVLRAELAGSGVRATLVSPGPVDTALWDEVDPDTRPGFTPRAMMLSATAVADAVLYAVSQPPAVNVDELRLTRA